MRRQSSAWPQHLNLRVDHSCPLTSHLRSSSAGTSGSGCRSPPRPPTRRSPGALCLTRRSGRRCDQRTGEGGWSISCSAPSGSVRRDDRSPVLALRSFSHKPDVRRRAQQVQGSARGSRARGTEAVIRGGSADPPHGDPTCAKHCRQWPLISSGLLSQFCALFVQVTLPAAGRPAPLARVEPGLAPPVRVAFHGVLKLDP